MTIADTDVLIDFLADKGAAESVQVWLSRGILRTTAITRFELLSGARSAREKTRLERLLEAVPALDPDNAAVDMACEIRRELERKGIGIGMADTLIAGIAVSNHAGLLTRNRRHFERVPGLKLV